MGSRPLRIADVMVQEADATIFSKSSNALPQVVCLSVDSWTPQLHLLTSRETLDAFRKFGNSRHSLVTPTLRVPQRRYTGANKIR
ncbi:hypothetical protein DACRYDRAFT_109848 [Dacryopinax primogenitus]|uniref:Uncharacterized protein n=1 Tax=Dacryopinax primogenitus (strain DJM 731) TaxID=1858805 RepID=M5G7J5_DACPD|nr:uncharacterized protein DACRYDRAFT_109848 [Dacryopinax primogenitus]EJT99742.1 hypothetical protein DACRYDRAFT_109848 [Dacryopinax primogenitus]